jgi:signal transduction histidine kinase/CheY-like chemotaxis protein
MGPWQRLLALPLGPRLTGLIALCAGLTAVLCLLTVFVTSVVQEERRSRAEASELARTLAAALQAPVVFEDRAALGDTLSVLKSRGSVRGAWVLGPGRVELTRYGTEDLPSLRRTGGMFAGYVLAQESIVADGQVVGLLVLELALGQAWGALFTNMLGMVVGSLLALAVSIWVAHHIARLISTPIGALSAAASAIARNQDYSQRLPAGGSDEVGAAINAFNHMLAELQAQSEALVELRVTARTRTLQAEKEEAQAASLAKSSFLSNMSHELRTPLNAVIGAAQLLDERGLVDDSQAHLVSAIRDSGTRLLGLIENVLDLSRIEAGAFDLMHEDFNLVDCIEAAVATAAVPARIKGVVLSGVLSPELPDWRHGDALRLRQVLLNLLGNAVKFTLQGQVVLRVQVGASLNAVRFSVTDTGIGMTAEALQRIFEPFQQADGSTTRRFGGSGLGLSISRQLVQAMGGEITVTSQPGRGSCFEFELALPAATNEHVTPAMPVHDVLYFEPDMASAQALNAMLQRLGCRAQSCSTVAEVKQWFGQRPAEAPAPWLLVALDQPDTWPLLEASLNDIDHERVIGMSMTESHTVEMARELFRVPRSIIKPVTRSALVSRIGAVERRRLIGQAIETPGPAHQRRHVLVVEDDPINQMILCTMLHNAGCTTVTADDGTQALACLSQQAFDLVFLDWQMPDMDGLEVARRLRAGVAGRFGKTVPIVAVTANAFVEDRVACLAAGMNDFLTKPVLASSLEAALDRWAQGPSVMEAPPAHSAFTPLVATP